jgi:hypothetical protein
MGGGKIMTTKQAIKILRLHNRWRRGAEIRMQEPGKIGKAIEVICDAVEITTAAIGEIVAAGHACEDALDEAERMEGIAREALKKCNPIATFESDEKSVARMQSEG